MNYGFTMHGRRSWMVALAALLALILWDTRAFGQAQTRTSPSERPGVRRLTDQGQAKDAARQSGARSTARRSGGGAGGATIVKGGTGTGGGVRLQGSGKFNPIERKPIVYGEVPDEGDTLTLTGPMPAAQFLEWINKATGWNILPTPEAQGVSLEFWIKDMKPKDALNILKFHKVYYAFDADARFLYVMTEEQYRKRTFDQLEKGEFPVTHVDLGDVEEVLSSLLSEDGRMITDARTSRVYVYDHPENLDEMERIIGALDIPVDSRTFVLQFVGPEAVQEVIQSVMTEQGILRIDPRTNTLELTDVPERLEQAANIIAALDKKLETRTWTINYAEPDDLADRVSMLVPPEMGEIVVSEDTHLLTVTAVPERLSEIDTLIKSWDIPRRQVHIEAYLVTASSQIARELGIEWAYLDKINGTPFSLWQGSPSGSLTSPPESGQRISVGSLPAADLLRDSEGKPITDINNNPIVEGWRFGNDLSGTLNYLETRGDVNVLSQGRVTVQDGEEAVFENTTQVPYAGSTSIDYLSNGNERLTTNVETVDVGTILKVLPRISEDGNILLEVSAEDSSSIFREFTASGERNTAPEKTQNKTETVVMVQNGDTLVIGGLRQSSLTDNEEKFPMLGDLPLVGRAFKTTTKDHRDSDLMVFITSTIVDQTTSPEALQIAHTDVKVADTMRADKKPAWGRWLDNVTKNGNEISISVGQSGALYTQGDLATVEDLRGLFQNVKVPKAVSVVIRKHPRAPDAIVDQIVEAAMEADLKVDVEKNAMAFVPATKKE